MSQGESGFAQNGSAGSGNTRQPGARDAVVSTRFETNPTPRLIAAAHAGCSPWRSRSGCRPAAIPPTELTTEAAVTLEPEGQGFRISRSP